MATKQTISDRLLASMHEARASDLILSPDISPRLRVDGELAPAEQLGPLSGDHVRTLLEELLDADRLSRFDAGHEVDFSLTWRGQARVRGNAFRTLGRPGLALRMVPQDIPTLESLGAPAAVHALTGIRQGLVLVTGPTGSGKSTTLAAVIDKINSDRACHVVTVEDPVEYVFTHRKATIHQREVGTDTPTFPSALRAALREDPDVLLVGEMRDLESIAFALTLAETGHLVLSTLHTNDAAQALDRLVDVFDSQRQPQIRVQLANALTAIVSQRLVPRIDGGMVAAFEVLVADGAVRNLVKEGKTNQLRNVISTHQALGMRTLEQDLNRLVEEGVVDVEQARLVSLYPKDVKEPSPVLAAVPGNERRILRR